MLVGEIIDPILFEKQKEVAASLPDDMTRVVPDSPYTMTAALVNTVTTDHVDRKDWPGGYAMMSPLGNFEGGDLGLRQLGRLLTYQPGTLVALTSHELSHFTKNWSGENRYSIVNVCQTFPRKVHLMMQQAQGVKITDPEDIQLLKTKSNRKADGHDDEKEEVHGESSTNSEDFSLHNELGEQNTTSGNQTVGGEPATKKRILSITKPKSTTKRAYEKKAKMSKAQDGDEYTPILVLDDAPEGVEEGDQAWPITILDDEAAPDTHGHKVEDARMGEKSVPVNFLDD